MFKRITKIKNKCIQSSDSSRIDGVILGVEVIVHNCWHQDVNHLGQAVLQQMGYFLQRLQGVKVNLAVGLLQSGFKGIKHLKYNKAKGNSETVAFCLSPY